MRYLFVSALVCIGLMLVAASQASAQGIYIGPGGVGVGPSPYYDYPPPPPPPRYPPRHYGPPSAAYRISQGEAVRIARYNGLERVFDIGRRGPNWIVRGESRRGRDMSVGVNSISGDVSISR